MSTDPRTIISYNQNAGAYHDHVSAPDNSPYHAYYEKPAIRAELPDLHGLTVLSIGCGSGVDTVWLRDNGAEKAVGVDISEGLIEIAKAENPEMEFMVMDMENLRFDDESFDLCVSSLAIHYLPDWNTALSEAFRVLQPGGQYIFSCGHPIESAQEHRHDDHTKKYLLGRIIDKATNERDFYGDYMAADNNGLKPIDAIIETADVHAYHQSLSRIINSITSSGFSIEKLVEPLPTQEMKQKFPDEYEKLIRIPNFMICVLRKPIK